MGGDSVSDRNNFGGWCGANRDVMHRDNLMQAAGCDGPVSEGISKPLGGRKSGEWKSAVNAPQKSYPAPIEAKSEEWRLAQERANLCEEFLALMRTGEHSVNQAAAAVGKSASYFSGANCMLARYERGGVAALVERKGPAPVCGDLSKSIEALGWFVPAANQFFLYANWTFDRGSVPEAVRRTLSLPSVPVGWGLDEVRRLLKKIGIDDQGKRTRKELIALLPACPREIIETCLAREKAGQQLVPQRIARQITLNPAIVRQYRNPREAGLDYLSAPGGMRLVADYGVEGGKRLARAGEIIEADDATINFPVCVPWARDGSDDPCVRKFGVKLARFQWLVTIDVGTSFVTAWSYTARPRSSYRAEDIVSLLRRFARQHGAPKVFRFERGAWESKLVKDAVRHMGSRLDTVYSPHQKPFIEGLFNTLWTKLSVQFPGGHVGRFMGEEREANLLLASCVAGHKDPRRYFPMMNTALEAFAEVVAEKNRTPVNTESHGRWVPEERWEAEHAEHLRVLDPETDWMFAPFMREWTVKGMLVGGRVPMFEKLSVPFDFSAPWLTSYDGARVKCYFDPADPKCAAMVELAEAWNGKQRGTLLGPASQVNQAAGYVRLVMGWGDDAGTEGLRARQQAAAQLRREVRAVLPRGARASGDSETRDGLGGSFKVEAPPLSISGASNEDEKTDTQEQRSQESAERARRAEEMFKKNPLEFI
jgi:transposase InsO family protein